MSETYETKRNNTMNEIREALECINTGKWRQLEGSVGRWANSWIENGVLKGYTYYTLNFQISNTDILSTLITPLEHNKDAQHILQSYIRRNKRLKLIPLNN